MTAPSLRIPLGLDTVSFEKSIGEAKSLTSQATEFFVKEFAKNQLKLAVKSDTFKDQVGAAAKFMVGEFDRAKPQIQAITQSTVREATEASMKAASVMVTPAIRGTFQTLTAVGVPAVQGLAQAVLPLAARFLAAYAAVELVAGAVSAAREQIEKMIAIADKATNLTVSPRFLQLFEAESRKLKVTTDDLDAALSHAFSATKEKSPIDVAKWEVAKERITDVELALRVYNLELEKSTGKRLEGLVLFRDADSQEQKVRAVLAAMVQLEQVGQKAAALDIGEKMFGSQFVDNIRQGKTSAESMLETMDKLAKSGDGIFTDVMVKRAKEVDDQLKLSQERLSLAMKPSWDDIASVILTIKGYWSDVVSLIAQAVEWSNKLGKTPGLQDIYKDELNKEFGKPSSQAQPAATVTPQERLNSAFDAFGEKSQTRVVVGANTKTSRGEGSAPTLRKTGEDSSDALDKAIDATNKRIATLKAEAENIDATTEARERAKTVAQLEEAAKRANTAAGLKNTEVTAAQREAIEKEADALGKAAAAYEKRSIASQIKFNAGTAFLSQDDVAIAQQLKGLYPDIATALGSAEAQAMRFNNAMRSMADLGQEVNRGLFTDFTAQIRNGASAMDALKTAGTNALGKIADKLASMAADNLWSSAFGGSTGGGLMSLLGLGSSGGTAGTIQVGSQSFPSFGAATGGLISGPGGPTSDSILARVSDGEYVVNADATKQYFPLIDAMNNGRMPRYADGGYVGTTPNSIVPNDIVRSMGGDSSQFTFAPSIDARGADAAAVARLEQVVLRQQAEFEGRVKKIVANRPKNRW